ncbi:universal stress protein [Pantanalinema rosaneae CENA516]|uniref:universal stress protein n=1 Tax=Pantanalinema rosaneae TaxID=1620701 RepID=UPI003D6E7ACB
MFTKILVAIDHSSLATVVFETALGLAKTSSAQLMLVHVLSSDEEGSPLPIPPNADTMYWSPGNELNLELWRQQWETYAAENLKTLQALAATARQAGVTVEFQQLPDSPGRAICRLARTWDADLILLGSRGRSGLQELLLGSVSNYVLHHAPCSVFVVKGGL